MITKPFINTIQKNTFILFVTNEEGSHAFINNDDDGLASFSWHPDNQKNNHKKKF